MKTEIKLLDVVDQIGYKEGMFKSRKELSYIAKYFWPAYASLFETPYNMKSSDFNSLDSLASFMIESGFPGKLESTILL